MEFEAHLVADFLLIAQWVCQLEGEDGFPPAAVRPQPIDDIIESIVYAVVEAEVVGQVCTVAQLEQLKLLYPAQVEEGDLYLLLILDLVTCLLLLLLHMAAAHIPQYLNGLALVVEGELSEGVLVVVGEEVVQQALQEVLRVVVAAGLSKMGEALYPLGDRMRACLVGGQQAVQEAFVAHHSRTKFSDEA
jgi:hypothetical protein